MPQSWPSHDWFKPEVGAAWQNDRGRVLFQWRCSFSNSCGRCIEMAGAIGRWWPLPLHRGCRCTNVAIVPGERSAPGLDYREEVRRLDRVQQTRVIGRANLQLVEAGLVRWDQVVERTRIRTLRQVIDERGLSAEQLRRAGVSEQAIRAALADLNRPAAELADRRREALLAALAGRGLTPDQIRNELGRRLAARVGVIRPSGGGPTRITPPPPPPPEPAPIPSPPPAPPAVPAPAPRPRPAAEPAATPAAGRPSPALRARQARTQAERVADLYRRTEERFTGDFGPAGYEAAQRRIDAAAARFAALPSAVQAEVARLVTGLDGIRGGAEARRVLEERFGDLQESRLRTQYIFRYTDGESGADIRQFGVVGRFPAAPSRAPRRAAPRPAPAPPPAPAPAAPEPITPAAAAAVARLREARDAARTLTPDRVDALIDAAIAGLSADDWRAAYRAFTGVDARPGSKRAAVALIRTIIEDFRASAERSAEIRSFR